jgi:hypothetical protein
MILTRGFPHGCRTAGGDKLRPRYLDNDCLDSSPISAGSIAAITASTFWTTFVVSRPSNKPQKMRIKFLRRSEPFDFARSIKIGISPRIVATSFSMLCEDIMLREVGQIEVANIRTGKLKNVSGDEISQFPLPIECDLMILRQFAKVVDLVCWRDCGHSLIQRWNSVPSATAWLAV